MQQIAQTLPPSINLIKRQLSVHTFFALELYQSLVMLQQQRWDQAISKCLQMTNTPPSSPEARDVASILAAPLSTLRGLVLRSFPERLVDIRTAASGGPLASAISEVTFSTLTYLEMLPQYGPTVEGLLSSSHSERSWLMGAKEAPSMARSASEEGGVLNLYVGGYILPLKSPAHNSRHPRHSFAAPRDTGAADAAARRPDLSPQQPYVPPLRLC